MSGDRAESVTLPSRWRAAVADDHLRRAYQKDDFDHSGWTPIDVPSHWQRNPAFSAEVGPILYRTTWGGSPAADGERTWLVFDGIMYQSDIWLDGEYLGDTEGYFFPHAFEITDRVKSRSDHVLAAEVSCTQPGDVRRKRNLTGVFQDADWLDRSLNPGGIWRPVRVERSGPVRITHHRVIGADADTERAVIALRAVLHSVDERTVKVRTRVCGVEHLAEQRLAAGENQLAWTVTVPEPELWWPYRLGTQPTHEAEIAIVLEDGSISDRRCRRVGLRSVALDAWRCSINGERLFLQGSGLAPTGYWLAEAGRADFERELGAIRDCGLNLVRVEGHVSRPELYEVADELGLLIWQDMPLQWGYHRSVRRQAVRQAREAVDMLGHHPSVILWCGHNEPVSVVRYLADPAPGTRRRRQRLQVLDQELLTYNRQILDRSIGRALRAADPSRPIVFHGGALPSLPRLDGTDNRLALGWERGDERDLPSLCATLPRLARFVGGFGAATVPDDVDLGERAAWPELDWDRLAARHGMDRGAFERYVPPAAFDSAQAWVEATRDYQATVVRHHVEELRRLKYRPCGGYTVALWRSPLPAISTALHGADGTALPALDALRAACRPVIVVADRPLDHLHAGEEVSWRVHVVSDLREPLDGVRVVARVRTTSTDERQGWCGDVEADGVVEAGIVRFVAPDHTTPLTLDLTLSHPSIETTTVRYETLVVAEPHEH